MPLVLTAAVATAAAAAAVVVPLLGQGGGGAVHPRKPRPSSVVALNARTFLLTAAETAAAAPAPTSGRYWHLRTRMCSGKTSQVGGKQTAYVYTACESEDTWTTRTGSYRVVIGIDPKVTFNSPQDEARWRAAGAPALTQKLAWTENDDPQYAIKWGVGGTVMTLRQLQELPTDPVALRKVMARSARGNLSGTALDSYIWTFTSQLFSEPITPDTRAGLYRMLAEIPGVHTVGTTKDSEGHPVVILGYVQHIPGTPARRAQNGLPGYPAQKSQDVEDDLAFRQDTYAFLSDQFGQGKGSVTNEQLIAEWTNVEGARQGSHYSD